MQMDRTTELERQAPEATMVKEAPAPEPRSVSASFAPTPAAAAPDDDFLAMFDEAPEARAEAPVFMEMEEEAEPSLQVASEPELEAQAIRAERDIRQALPLENPTQAMALAAMPHYELGGKPGVVVGKAEMRFLLAEAEATVRGPEQNILERVEAKPTLDWSDTAPEVQASHQRAVDEIHAEIVLHETTRAAIDRGVEEPVVYRFAALVKDGQEPTANDTPELAKDLQMTHMEDMKKGFEATVADLNGLVRDFRTKMENPDDGARTRRLVLEPSQMADRNIESLVKAGYIEPIKATPEVREAIMRVNEYLREAAPAEWAVTEKADPGVAYRLTDAGIAAGRSVRAWDGDSPEAGLVRLPKGSAMPPEVASDSYSVAAMMMENKANAGILKAGEMGAFLRAEMSSIEYDAKLGLRPAITLGRVEGILEGATDSALQQNEVGHTARTAPITVADIQNLVDRSRALVNRLPDLQEVSDDPSTANARWLNKDLALNMAARLEGVGIGNKLIYYDIEKAAAGQDMTRPEAWADSKTSTPDLRATLSTVRMWLNDVAESTQAAKRELAAMAEGVFGEQGKAVAASMS